MSDVQAPQVTDPAPVEPAAPAAEPTPTEPVVEYPDWYNDPAKVKAEITRLNNENAASRVNAKEAAATEARQKILKDLGLIKEDEQVDPAQLRDQLAQKDTTIRDLTVRSALSEALSTANAKPLARAAILGSGVLNDLDPASADFSTQVAEKVTAYVAANPELKASQAAAVGGVDLTGGASPARIFRTEQLNDPLFYQANKAEIEAAVRDGRVIN